MAGRIITARHGRPDLSREVKLSAADYGEWWQEYDRSGLAPDQTPPDSLVSLAKNAATILSSDLPRALETAHAIAGRDDIVGDAAFVEAHLPPPPFPLIKAGPQFWGVASRVCWMMGYAPGDFEPVSKAWQRVGRFTDRLIEESQHGDVVLCAHGYLNWMIDRELRKRRQWAMVARDRGNDYWSWRAYLPSAVDQVATNPDMTQATI